MRVIFLVLSSFPLLFSHSSLADCKVVWGKGKTLKSPKGICSFELQGAEDRPILLSLSLPEKMDKSQLRMELKLEGKPTINGLEIRLGSKKDWSKYISHLIPMFADPSFNWILREEWNPMSFSLNHFEGKQEGLEMDNLYVYLEIPAGESLKISFKDLQVLKSPFIGKGKISLTFDDGYESVYQGFEIMKKLDIPGTAYIIRKGLNSPNFLTRSQVCEMAKAGWSISYHHEIPFTELANLEELLTGEALWLQLLCSPTLTFPQHVAYPLGKQNKKIREIVQRHFTTARIASGGVETMPVAFPLALRTVNVLPQISPEKLVKMAQKAVESGDWIIFMFHYLKEKPSIDLEYSLENFEKLVKGLKPLQASVVTVPQAYRFSKSK